MAWSKWSGGVQKWEKMGESIIEPRLTYYRRRDNSGNDKQTTSTNAAMSTLIFWGVDSFGRCAAEFSKISFDWRHALMYAASS